MPIRAFGASSLIISCKFQDFGHSGPGSANASVGCKLTEIFVRLTRSLSGVGDVCDLGCGNGYLASRLDARGFRVTGVDASESGLEIARRHYATERVTFVHADLGVDIQQWLPMEARFDVVVSQDVIEYLYRPAAPVDAARARLKPGGHQIVGTPYHGYLKNLAISVLNRWDSRHGVHWDGSHIKFLSKRTLRELVARRGFGEAVSHCYGRFPWPWKHMICVARRGG